VDCEIINGLFLMVDVVFDRCLFVLVIFVGGDSLILLFNLSEIIADDDMIIHWFSSHGLWV